MFQWTTISKITLKTASTWLSEVIRVVLDVYFFRPNQDREMCKIIYFLSVPSYFPTSQLTSFLCLIWGELGLGEFMAGNYFTQGITS